MGTVAKIASIGIGAGHAPACSLAATQSVNAEVNFFCAIPVHVSAYTWCCGSHDGECPIVSDHHPPGGQPLGPGKPADPVHAVNRHPIAVEINETGIQFSIRMSRKKPFGRRAPFIPGYP